MLELRMKFNNCVSPRLYAGDHYFQPTTAAAMVPAKCQLAPLYHCVHQNTLSENRTSSEAIYFFLGAAPHDMHGTEEMISATHSPTWSSLYSRAVISTRQVCGELIPSCGAEGGGGGGGVKKGKGGKKKKKKSKKRKADL